MRKQGKPLYLPAIALCLMAIPFVAAMSVYSSTPHVLPIVDGDMLRAILFCLPIPMIGLVFEFFMSRSTERTRWIYDAIIRVCWVFGSLGFVSGVGFDAYNPFPDVEFNWPLITLIAQVCLDVSLIHAFWGWLEALRKARREPVPNAYKEVIRSERDQLDLKIQVEENLLDERLAKFDHLRFEHWKANTLGQAEAICHIIEKEEQALANDEGRFAYLRLKLHRPCLAALSRSEAALESEEEALATDEADFRYLCFAKERATTHLQAAALDEQARELEEDISRDEAMADFLAHKMKRSVDFQQALRSVQA